MDLGTIWASVGLKTAPLAAGVAQAKGMMSGLDASLSTGKLKGAETGLASLGTKLKNLAGLGGGASSALGGVGASIGTLGQVGIAAAAVAGLGAALFECAKEAAEVQKITAQTEAVIASTGGVANVTAAHVEKLGGKLRDLSGIDDEVIKTGANILLTFRGIHNEVGKGNDIFDQATKATLDLSVAMGRDMSKSAIMVGKALQDPVRGLTAMRRVGVQFTASQEEMIKNMVATGNTIGAQKIILAELNAEFGKSAEAYGKTLPGQIGKLKSAFGDLKESIGMQMLAPAISSIQELTLALKGLEIASKLSIGNMIKSMGGLKTEAPGVFDTIWSGVQKIKGVWKEAFPTTVKPPIINKSGLLDLGGVIDGLTGKFSNLRSMMDSAFAQMGEDSKDLADTLGTLGLKGVMDTQIGDMVSGMSSAQPRIRDAAYGMVQQIIDAEARANPVIAANATAMMDSIKSQIEQLPAEQLTAAKVAEITASVLAGQGPTGDAMSVLIANLVAIAAGNPPVITPQVDTGAALAQMQAMVAHPITWFINTVVNPAATSNPVLRQWSTNAAAGAFVAGEIRDGLRSVPLSVSATVVPGGAGTNKATGIAAAQNALTSTFGSFISEMKAAPILEVEQAINALTTADWGLLASMQANDAVWDRQIKQHELDIILAKQAGNEALVTQLENEKAGIEQAKTQQELDYQLKKTNKTNEASLTIWRNAKTAYETAAASLTKYETRLKAAQTAIDKLNEKLQASEKRSSKAQEALDKLSSMKLLGEGAAADRSFAQDEASKKLQLQIMQAEDAHQYAKVRALTLEKEKLDRTKEEADLQTSITYDPQRRELEKLLDPLKGREMSEKEIAKQIAAAQSTLAKEARTQSTIKYHIDQQTKSMKLLQDQYDVAKLKVDKFKEQIDNLASFFISKYRDMAYAAGQLNNVIGATGGSSGAPGYQTGGPVFRTGPAILHAGEFVLSKEMLGGGTTKGRTKVAPLAVPTMSSSSVVIPLYLDGKIVAKTVAKIQGGKANAYAVSGGKY